MRPKQPSDPLQPLPAAPTGRQSVGSLPTTHRGTSLRLLLPLLACILIVAAGSATASPHPVLAETEIDHCTAIGMGRKATANGATMIAHTDDRCDPGVWTGVSRGGMDRCDLGGMDSVSADL